MAAIDPPGPLIYEECVYSTMTENSVLESLRDTALLKEALTELGLDIETIQLIADLSPSRGVTALAIETSVSVG